MRRFSALVRRYRLPLLSLVVEGGPVLVFFIVEAYTDFFTALGALIGATVVGVTVSLALTRSLPWFALLGGALLVGAGTLSIVFKDEAVFIVQDTLANLFLGIVLFATANAKTPLLKRFFSRAFAITDRAWRALNLRWGTLFLLIALGNEVVRLTASPDVWVQYRAWSVGAIIVFGMYQFTLSARERIPGESNAWGLRITADRSNRPRVPR
jgi:intracellular septation protein